MDAEEDDLERAHGYCPLGSRVNTWRTAQQLFRPPSSIHTQRMPRVLWTGWDLRWAPRTTNREQDVGRRDRGEEGYG